MTDTNAKLRALFLTALMVFSVFAGTVALTGTAAANHNATGVTADEHLESQGTFWQGQVLWFDVDGSQNSDDEVQVRRVTSDGDIGGLVSERPVHTGSGPHNNATVDTSNLEGDYVVVNDTHVLNFGNNGVFQSKATRSIVNSNENASDHSFEVAVQTLSAEFDEDDLPADTGDVVTLEMDSNRGSYVVNISAEGLDQDELAEIFADSNDGNDFVAASTSDDNDDEVQVETTSDGTIEANFTQQDAASYTFDLEVNDTTASASASIDVSSEDVSLNFAQNLITQQEGDVAVITVLLEDTDEGYLWIGDDDSNYLERVHFKDDNGDGVVVVLMNTRWVGTTTSATLAGSTGPTGDNSSLGGTSATARARGFGIPGDKPHSEDDILGVDRFNSSTSDLSDLDRDIQAAPLSEPLDATDYPMALSSTDALPNASSDGELVINDEEDVATLDLTERSTDSISLWHMPSGDADEFDEDDDEDVAELLDSISPTDTLAIGTGVGDRLVVMVNASGLSGYIFDGDITGNMFNGDNGVWLNVTEEGQSNRADARINLSDDAHMVDGDGVPDDSFLVVIDSTHSSYASTFDDGDEFTVSFQVGHEDMSSSPNPYVDTEEEERIETTLNIEDTDAEFNNVVDDEVQVAQDEEATVSGTSNVAPGEEVSIRLRKTGDSPFLMTQTVEVGSDGSFEATFDTSALPVDTEFTAEVREGGTSISDKEDARIVESTTATPTTEPPETTTEPPETTTEPPETTTAPPETTTEPPATTETPGQPGFGLAIAIVALLGAALLALRRRD